MDATTTRISSVQGFPKIVDLWKFLVLKLTTKSPHAYHFIHALIGYKNQYHNHIQILLSPQRKFQIHKWSKDIENEIILPLITTNSSHGRVEEFHEISQDLTIKLKVGKHATLCGWPQETWNFQFWKILIVIQLFAHCSCKHWH